MYVTYFGTDLLNQRVKAIIQRDYWQNSKALVSRLRD